MFGVQERLGLGLLLTVNPQKLSVAVRSRVAREKISLWSEVLLHPNIVSLLLF